MKSISIALFAIPLIYYGYQVLRLWVVFCWLPTILYKALKKKK